MGQAKQRGTFEQRKAQALQKRAERENTQTIKPTAYKPRLQTLAALAALACLTACSALDSKLQNRITVTLDCNRAFVASLYGPFGLTSEIDKADVTRLPCRSVSKP